ncbi:MAG: tRNA-dihydrouridine synthase, partial [candidate division Zixibacteria bacterium]|nr:tRNA-dihydrouridine synthase [candidate division Zixibacteria bacterium]
PQDVKEMLDQTGCDGVMIGRGALGNPWIFNRANHYLEKNELLPEPSEKEVVEVALKHLQLSVQESGEYYGILKMRKHLLWYIRRLTHNQELRKKILSAEKYEELKKGFELYLSSGVPSPGGTVETKT